MIVQNAYWDSHIQLRVELRDIVPAISRRLVVPEATPLDVVHAIFQVAFGWTDSHLHDFQVGDVRFGIPDVEDDVLIVDERAAPLGAVARKGSTLVYRYDFGDDWVHDVTVEEVIEPDGKPLRVVCLDGARACPPEDCGGPYGYDNLLRVLRDPKDEEHADLKRWVGRRFDAEKFNVARVNKQLAVIGRGLERGAKAARERSRRGLT